MWAAVEQSKWFRFDLDRFGGSHEDSPVGAAVGRGDGRCQGAARPPTGVGPREGMQVFGFDVGPCAGTGKIGASYYTR